MKQYSITANRIHTMTGIDGGVGGTGVLERQYINVSCRKIVSLSFKPQFDDVTDYGDKYDILPGMINAHAHLELSQLKSPIKLQSQPQSPLQSPSRSQSQSQKYCDCFDQWIKQLMQFRKSAVYDPIDAVLEARRYFAGIWEVAAVVDIVPFGLNFDRVDIGKEIIWLRFPELIAWDSISVAQKIESIRGLPKNSYTGLSPHAPHTVAAALLEFAADRGVAISMHLAESPDEMKLLKSHDGKLLEMMRRVDESYEPSKILAGNRAMDYLQILSRAPRVLVIHGNYLDESEMKFLAKHRETMAVVYTPRSHDYFGFDEFPLQKMLDIGVCVLLGTDSKASTPDLSLSNEIKHATSVYPTIPIEKFFQMATIQSAKFLNLTQNYGTIESDKNAVFTFIKNY